MYIKFNQYLAEIITDKTMIPKTEKDILNIEDKGTYFILTVKNDFLEEGYEKQKVNLIEFLMHLVSKIESKE